MALVNLLSFNFGFHVHEKALMLVTIPLSLVLFQSQHSKDPSTVKEMMVDLRRFKLLKLLMLWSYFPLIYTQRDIPNRTFLMPLDWVLMILVMRYQLRHVLQVSKSLFSYRELAYWILTIALGLSLVMTVEGLRNLIIDTVKDFVMGKPAESFN